MTYFEGIKNLEELKKAYRKLAMKNHPDIGGDWKVMAAINAEYEMLFNRLPKESKEEQEQAQDFPDIINSIINLSGIEIEICGSWVWVSGNTYYHKEKLKELKFNWASKKKMWYWHSPEEVTRRKKSLDMDKIREKYGSEKVRGNMPFALA